MIDNDLEAICMTSLIAKQIDFLKGQPDLSVKIPINQLYRRGRCYNIIPKLKSGHF